MKSLPCVFVCVVVHHWESALLVSLVRSDQRQPVMLSTYITQSKPISVTAAVLTRTHRGLSEHILHQEMNYIVLKRIICAVISRNYILISFHYSGVIWITSLCYWLWSHMGKQTHGRLSHVIKDAILDLNKYKTDLLNSFHKLNLKTTIIFTFQ